MSLAMPNLQAQNDSIPNQQQKIQELKEKIIKEEKDLLRIKLESINYRLEQGSITAEEAEKQKEDAAKTHALNIENKIAILENEVALRQREGNNSTYLALQIFEDGKPLNLKITDGESRRKYDRRTSSDLVLAAGLNNAISDENSIDNSDFKIGGSRFFEIGWAWKTRVFNNTNFMRVKYGVSFQFNGLKPTDNRVFVENGDLTELEEFPIDLDKSKFRSDNLVFPVHFEFGPSKKIERENYYRYSTNDQFKIGLGGYAGFNIGERQKLKI